MFFFAFCCGLVKRNYDLTETDWSRVSPTITTEQCWHQLTWRSCLAASALALLLKVTKPTGDAVLPFLLVTFNKEPS